MKKKYLLLPILIFSLVACYFYSQINLFRIEKNRQQSPTSNIRKWAVPTPVIEILAGEFKGLLANIINMEIGAQLGAEIKKEQGEKYSIVSKNYDWETIIRLFHHSITLDPYFQQTYIVAQGWLPWEANNVEVANAILRIAKENRTWDWRPTHLIGFNTYYFLNDPGEAGKIFLEAAKIPNAPSFLAILGARLAHKGNTVESAIPLMQSMLALKDPNEPGYQNIKNRLEALQGVYVIEQAIKLYEQNFDEKPADLNDLTEKGILQQLPLNPYNEAYCMDKEGKIHFDSLNCQ